MVRKIPTPAVWPSLEVPMALRLIERVDVDLEFVLPAAEHVAVAHAHVRPV